MIHMELKILKYVCLTLGATLYWLNLFSFHMQLLLKPPLHNVMVGKYGNSAWVSLHNHSISLCTWYCSSRALFPEKPTSTLSTSLESIVMVKPLHLWCSYLIFIAVQSFGKHFVFSHLPAQPPSEGLLYSMGKVRNCFMRIFTFLKFSELIFCSKKKYWNVSILFDIT